MELVSYCPTPLSCDVIHVVIITEYILQFVDIRALIGVNNKTHKSGSFRCTLFGFLPQ